MKFLQLHSFYEPYLQHLYGCNEQLRNLSFNEQMAELIRDGFSGCHIIAPYMQEHGIKGELVVTNCPFSQERWARENGFTSYSQSDWQFSIVARQIETIKPDILYISHPIGYDSNFLNQLSWKPEFVFGWRSADIPPGLNLSNFNLMLTSCEPCYKDLLKHGAQAVEYHSPGIPIHIWDEVKDTKIDTDVTFIGQWSSAHQKRAEYLKAIGKSPLGFRGEFSIAYHLLVSDPKELPASVAMHNKGPVFGLDMYRALHRAKIGVNGIIDFAGKEAGNMRMFEVTASGSLLLTEHDDSIKEYFEPGVEVVTFNDTADLLDKLYYYLEHEQEREEIAERGRKRCYQQHSLSEKVKDVVAFIEKYTSTKINNSGSSRNTSVTICFNEAEQASHLTKQALLEMEKQNRSESDSIQPVTRRQISEHLLYLKPADQCNTDDIEKMLEQAVKRIQINPESGLDCVRIADQMGIKFENLEFIRGLCLLAMGRNSEAENAFDKELELFPNNQHVAAIRNQEL